MSQVSEEIARLASEDNSKPHQSSYMSLHQHEMVEMTPADGNRAELDEQDAQHRDYGKLLTEMRHQRKRSISLLVLMLVFGVTSVILMSFSASREGEILTPKDEMAQILPMKTGATSTEAPYTQRSFTYLGSTENLGSSCYSAFYSNGNILVGTRDGVKLVNRTNHAVTSFNTSFKVITSVVEHRNVTYLLHQEGNVNKVELCFPEMNNCQTLLEFNNTSDYVSTMAMSSRYIVVMNPDGEKLIIYDLISKQSKIKQPAQLHHPYFLPDGHLLARNEVTLIKYRLQDGALTELWTCDGPTHPWTVVADTDGFIYVLADTEKSVYVISPDGELLQTIYNDNLPNEVGQASISGDEMAVPGWGDGKLHILKINN